MSTAPLLTATNREALGQPEAEPEILADDLPGSRPNSYSVVYWESFTLDIFIIRFCVRWWPAEPGQTARYELEVRFKCPPGIHGISDASAASPAGLRRPLLLWDVWDSVAFEWTPPSLMPGSSGRTEIDVERSCVMSHFVPFQQDQWHLKLWWPYESTHRRQQLPAGIQVQIQLQDGRRLEHPSNRCFEIPLCGEQCEGEDLASLVPGSARNLEEERASQLGSILSEVAAVRSQRQDVDKAIAVAEERIRAFQHEASLRPSPAALTDLEERLEEERMHRRLHQEEIMNLRGRIRIFCRIRGFRPEEGCITDQSAVVRTSHREVMIPSLQRQFEFDLVFGPETSTTGIWEETWPLIDSVFDQPGTSACVMAYGQTGAGKTFTMEGAQQHPGLIGLAMEHLFDRVARIRQTEMDAAGSGEETDHSSMQICLSMIEIYQEQLYDLLAPDGGSVRLSLRNVGGEGGPEVRELHIASPQTREEAMSLYQTGARLRRLGSSERNSRSSRSHMVFTLYIQCTETATGEVLSTSKISLVDLAGSERQSASSALDRSRVSEASVINNSLTSLSKVVQACVARAASPRPEKAGSCHIPYRDSVLTALLSDSIGGQGKTLVLVHVTPHEEDAQESLCTLQFAANAACVQERPAALRADEERCRRQLARAHAENIRLREELAAMGTGFGTPQGSPKTPRPPRDGFGSSSPKNKVSKDLSSPARGCTSPTKSPSPAKDYGLPAGQRTGGGRPAARFFPEKRLVHRGGC